jgi:hypothetical protein
MESGLFGAEAIMSAQWDHTEKQPGKIFDHSYRKTIQTIILALIIVDPFTSEPVKEGK